MLKKIVGFLLITLFFIPSICYGRLNVDVDLGVAVNIGDDDLYLRINARYFDKDPEYVRGIIRSHTISDRDYPVLLFLSYHSRKDVDFIFSLRREGLTWWDISVRFGIPVSVYFVDLNYKPGPPYGKAYGYWKKHKRNANYKFVLTDTEVYDLISLQIASRYYGMSPEEVIKMRSSGVNFKHIITNQYWKRHAAPGQEKNKDKGKGKANKNKHGKKN